MIHCRVRLRELAHKDWPPERRQPASRLLQMRNWMLFYRTHRLVKMAAKGRVALAHALDHRYRPAPL